MRWHGAAVLGSATLTLLGCKTSADLSRPDQTADAVEVPSEPVADAEEGDVPDADVIENEPEPVGETVGETAPEEEGGGPTLAEAPEPSSEPPPKAKPRAPALPKPKYTKVDASCGNDGSVGQKLQGFELPTTDGKSVRSGSYRGRVMVVNFWGTWCKPCLKELPEFDHLYRRYRQHGMTLVAIATDEDPVPVDDFVNKRKLAAKVLIGGEGYANQYGSPKFPFTFVVDHTGVIRASYRGYRPECMGKLEADIREQLHKRNG